LLCALNQSNLYVSGGTPLAEISGTISKLVDRIEISRRSIIAFAIGGCFVFSTALLVFDQPFNFTFQGSVWKLSAVAVVMCVWILAASVAHSIIGACWAMFRRFLSCEMVRIEAIERLIDVNALDDIIGENFPLDSLLDDGLEDSLGLNGFRVNLSQDIRTSNPTLMQGITELVSRGGIILTRENAASDVYFLELAPDLFDYRRQWKWSAMRDTDGSELRHLRVRTLSQTDRRRKQLLTLIGA
jgi:hypothetical protein